MNIVNQIINKLYSGEIFTSMSHSLRMIYYKLLKKNLYTFHILMGQHKYNEALQLGKMTLSINLNKLNADMYRKLAFCGFYANDRKFALENIKKSLELKSKITLDEILRQVINQITSFTNEVHINSKYSFFGGYSNYGFIEHTFLSKDGNEQKYLTKIIISKSKVDREVYFYNSICKRYPQLSTISSPYICSFKIRNLFFLTIRKIEGARPNNDSIDRIMNINKMIESIRFSEVKKYILAEAGKYNAKYQSMLLHKKSINTEIINDLRKILIKDSNNTEAKMYINRLKQVVIDGKLYKDINPELHYAFCHNDFHKNNILAEANNRNCYVIDWNCYSYSIKGWDMAYYFGNFEFTFDEIKELYIDKYLGNEFTDKTGILFYVYLQIYIWALRLRGENWVKRKDNYFLPALEYMELLASQIR